MTSKTNWTNWPFLGLGLALFGSLAITPDTLFMRLSGFDGWAMLAWRGLEMGLLLLCIWTLFNRKQMGAQLQQLRTRAGLGALAAQSSAGVLFTLAVAETSVAIVLFCLATGPIFAALFSILLLKERTRPATWIAMIAAFTGVAIAVLDGDSAHLVMSQGSGNVWLGALYAIGAGAGIGLSFVCIRMNNKLNIVLVTGLQASCSGLIGLSALLLTTGNLSDLFAGHIGYISVCGLLILPVSFVCLSTASRYTQAANVSLLMLLETILGPIWVWLGIGEAASLQMIVGGAIVVIALAIYIPISANAPK